MYSKIITNSWLCFVSSALILLLFATSATAAPKVRDKYYTSYKFILNTEMKLEDGRGLSLCIETKKSMFAFGYKVQGYVLSPNQCQTTSKLFGIFPEQDKEVGSLSQSDVRKLKADGILPKDLDDVPTLTIFEKIKASFVLLLVLAFIILFIAKKSLKFARPRNKPMPFDRLNVEPEGATKHSKEPSSSVSPSPIPTSEAGKFVWASEFILDDTVFAFYAEDAQSADDPELCKNAAARNTLGLRVGREGFPRRTLAMAPENYEYTSQHDNEIPEINPLAVIQNRFILVSLQLARIMHRFDLGEGGTYETDIYDSTGETRLDLDHRYWNFGARKQSFMPEESTGMKQANFGNNDPNQDYFSSHYTLQNDNICLSQDCLQGPDVWIEQNVRRLVFFSDGLVRAIHLEGLDEYFNFKRCRVAEQ